MTLGIAASRPLGVPGQSALKATQLHAVPALPSAATLEIGPVVPAKKRQLAMTEFGHSNKPFEKGSQFLAGTRGEFLTELRAVLLECGLPSHALSGYRGSVLSSYISSQAKSARQSQNSEAGSYPALTLVAERQPPAQIWPWGSRSLTRRVRGSRRATPDAAISGEPDDAKVCLCDASRSGGMSTEVIP